MSEAFDPDAMVERFRERAAAVKKRNLPAVGGDERARFIEQAQIDFQDYAMIGDATAELGRRCPDPHRRPSPRRRRLIGPTTGDPRVRPEPTRRSAPTPAAARSDTCGPSATAASTVPAPPPPATGPRSTGGTAAVSAVTAAASDRLPPPPSAPAPAPPRGTAAAASAAAGPAPGSRRSGSRLLCLRRRSAHPILTASLRLRRRLGNVGQEERQGRVRDPGKPARRR